MVGQTDYSANPPFGFAGMLADGGTRDVTTAVAQPNQILATIGNAVNGDVYALNAAYFSRNGTNYNSAVTEVITYTATVPSDTTTIIAAALTSAANADVNFPFDATSSGAVITLTPRLNSPSAVLTVDATTTGSITLSNTTGDIPYGVAVVMAAPPTGTNPTLIPQMCRLPSASGDVTGLAVLGLTLSTQFLESAPATDTGPARYPAGSRVNVMRTGRAWAVPDGTVTAGGPVYVRYAANGSNTQLGTLRGDADSSHAAQLTGARWLDTGSAGQVLRVEFNIV